MTQIKKILARKWHIFLLGILSVSAIISLGIYAKTLPNRDEKIIAYVCVDQVSARLFEHYALEKTNGIRQVRLHHETVDKSQTSSLFAHVFASADFYIFPEWQKERMVDASVHFSLEKISALLPHLQGFKVIENHSGCWAIQIYDQQTEIGIMEDTFVYSENTYLSFASDSNQIGGLNHSQYDNVLKMVDYFLSI